MAVAAYGKNGTIHMRRPWEQLWRGPSGDGAGWRWCVVARPELSMEVEEGRGGSASQAGGGAVRTPASGS